MVSNLYLSKKIFDIGVREKDKLKEARKELYAYLESKSQYK